MLPRSACVRPSPAALRRACFPRYARIDALERELDEMTAALRGEMAIQFRFTVGLFLTGFATMLAALIAGCEASRGRRPSAEPGPIPQYTGPSRTAFMKSSAVASVNAR